MAPQSLDLGLSLGLASQPSLCSSTSSPWNPALVVPTTPAAAAAEELASSRASPLSNGSGKRAERSSAGSEDDDGACDGNAGRKKLRLSKDQAAILEECFKTHATLTPKQKLALANSLNLRPRQVEVWFQNRRARTKLKQTEVDCEYLKQWCEQLAEENRRLEKEVAELRALKAAPPTSAGAVPVATLTMCLSCRRVGTSSSSDAAASIAGADIVLMPGHRRFFCGFSRDVVKAAR